MGGLNLLLIGMEAANSRKLSLRQIGDVGCSIEAEMALLHSDILPIIQSLRGALCSLGSFGSLMRLLLLRHISLLRNN